MITDEDCQPVEWWRIVSLTPPVVRTPRTSGVQLRTDGETIICWRDGSVVRIRPVSGSTR